MSKIVTIENVARIEGHASVALYINESGSLDKAEFLATEPSRGFDAIMKGKHASEIPRLAARICGICYTPHNICACKALENAWGTQIPESAKKIRELAMYANNLSSHALHIFFLAGPGMLLDGINTFADLKIKHPDFVEAGIKLREIGQDISEILGGRKVHTIGSAPGGVLGGLDQNKQDAIIKFLDAASESLEIIEKYTTSILQEKKDYLLTFGKINTHFVSLKQSKRLELYNSPIEVQTEDGKVSYPSDNEFFESITEEEKEYSYVRHLYLSDFGLEKGQFRTGPLARIQNAKWDNSTFYEFKKTFGEHTQSTMGYDIARVPEMIETIRAMKEIVDSGFDDDIKNLAKPKEGLGIAVVEAPRGLLLHQYETNKDGVVTKAKVIAPTTFHQGSIERSTYAAAKAVIGDKRDCCTNEEKLRIEQAIRAYDPCMSCAGATQLRVIKRPALPEVF